MKNKLFLFFYLLLPVLVNAQSEQTLTLQPVGGSNMFASVYANWPTSVDTGGSELNVYDWTYSGISKAARVYLQFNLTSLPSDAVIDSAFLNLYADSSENAISTHQATSGTNASVIYWVTSSWSRNTITWNNQPAYTPTDSVVLPQSTTTEQNYLNINMTGLVKDIVASSNYGFLVKLITESPYKTMIFYSPNGASGKQPKFVINYHLSGIQICLNDTSANPCSRPANYSFIITGVIWGKAPSNDSVQISLHFGDGIDSNFKSKFMSGPSSSSFFLSSFQHLYTDTGVFFPTLTATTTNGYYITDSAASPVVVYNGCAVIKGKLYLDLNDNCTYDSGEIPLPNNNVILSNDNKSVHAITDSAGNYIALVPRGEYIVTANAPDYLDISAPSCPSSDTMLVNAIVGDTVTANFANLCSTSNDSIDAMVSGIASDYNAQNPSHIMIYGTTVAGCEGEPATIKLVLDPHLKYIVDSLSKPSPNEIVNDTLIWNVATLSLNKPFFAGLTVLCDRNVALGDSLCNTVTITPTSFPDPNIENNSSTFCAIVQGPSRGVLALTEVSTTTRACQYVEMIVANCGSDTSSVVNIQGWIADLSFGDSCAEFQGTNHGHYRFAYDSVWSNVPVGSIIVMYNHDNNCYNLQSNYQIDTTSTGLVYWIPIGGTFSAPYGNPPVEVREITGGSSSASSCNFCNDSGTVYSTAAAWSTIIGITNFGEIQVRCPGCTSMYYGEPSFYHGFGWGFDTGVIAPIVGGSDDVGSAVINDTASVNKFVFIGSTQSDLGNSIKWSKLPADPVGFVPSTLGNVSVAFMNSVIHHSLNLPCCNEINNSMRKMQTGSQANGDTPPIFQTNIIASSDIKVYPNPAKTVVYFQFPAVTSAIIKILDITGRIIDQQTMNNSTKETVRISSCTPGIYMYVIVTNNQIYSGKLLIEK